MMPQPAFADPDLARRRADMADPMVAVLGTDRAITDSEALALLRRRYPHVAPSAAGAAGKAQAGGGADEASAAEARFASSSSRARRRACIATGASETR